MINDKIIEDLQKIESDTLSEDQFRLAQSRTLALQDLQSRKLNIATPSLLLFCITMFINFYTDPEKEYEQTVIQISDNQIIYDELIDKGSPFHYWLDIYDQF